MLAFGWVHVSVRSFVVGPLVVRRWSLVVGWRGSDGSLENAFLAIRSLNLSGLTGSEPTTRDQDQRL